MMKLTDSQSWRPLPRKRTRACGSGSSSTERVASGWLETGTGRHDAVEGQGLDDLIEATGWLPHTTRAALTGLRKRGFTVERTRYDTKGSLYRIVGDPKAVARA